MIIQDIAAATDATDAQNSRSGVDAISGVNVNGGLTLDNTTIRRISDTAIFGGTFGLPDVATVWNGLTINNSTIEDTNRFHVLHEGDANNEDAVRILGIRGTVNVTNSLFQRGAEFLDFFVTAGTLTMTVTNSQFPNAHKEFVAADLSPLGSADNHGIDVSVQGSADASIVIGDRANAALGNTFLNGRLGSVRVATDAGATGAVSVTWDTIRSGPTIIRAGYSAIRWYRGRFRFPPGRRLTTAEVKFLNKTGIRGFFSCPDASCGGYDGPWLRALADVQNGGKLDLTIDGDDFARHDTGFDPGQTFEGRALSAGTGKALCMNLQNNMAPDGNRSSSSTRARRSTFSPPAAPVPARPPARPATAKTPSRPTATPVAPATPRPTRRS